MWVTGILTTLPLLVAAVWRWACGRGADGPPRPSLADHAAQRAAWSRTRADRHRHLGAFRLNSAIGRQRDSMVTLPAQKRRTGASLTDARPDGVWGSAPRSGWPARRQRPVNWGGRRSRKLATPSLWSSEWKQRSMTSRLTLACSSNERPSPAYSRALVSAMANGEPAGEAGGLGASGGRQLVGLDEGGEVAHPGHVLGRHDLAREQQPGGRLHADRAGAGSTCPRRCRAPGRGARSIHPKRARGVAMRTSHIDGELGAHADRRAVDGAHDRLRARHQRRHAACRRWPPPPRCPRACAGGRTGRCRRRTHRRRR